MAIIDHVEGSGTEATASPSGLVQPRDEVGVDRGSRGGVVFANRAGLDVRHEEVVARQRECLGRSLSPVMKLALIDGSRGGVVFANRVAGSQPATKRLLPDNASP